MVSGVVQERETGLDSYLVGRGKLNWLSKMMIYIVNIFFVFCFLFFVFCLEYHAQKCLSLLPPALAKAGSIVKGLRFSRALMGARDRLFGLDCRLF